MNNDLISRSALLEAFGEEPLVWDSRDREDVQMRNDWLDYTKLAKEAPAVDAETVCEQMGLVKEAFEMAKADLVAVCRCKDCVYWREAKTNSKGFLICPASGMEIMAADFCSYGKRRADDATD